MTAIAILEGRDLGCVRGGRTVFEGLNFSVTAGNLLVVEGPNGSGKTSVLRIIAGLLGHAKGAVRMRTDSIAITEPEQRGRLCGWLGHQDGVKPQLTIGENLGLSEALYGKAGDVDAALDRVGLMRLENAPAQYLSAGQRRRLALARLIATARPVWLLDEPFASLDAGGRNLVGELVQEHCAANGIVVAATHEPLAVTAGRLVLGET